MWSQIKSLLTNKIFYLGLGSLIAAGALFLALLDFVIMPAYTNYNEGVTVPDITQVSLDEAQERLTSYGLRYEVAERRSNSAYPADYVIDQMPAAAEIVKPNRKVYLTVNTEANPTVQVPKVVDLSLRNAQIQLENYGLRVGTISYESSRFKNVVLRQSVPAENIVPKSTMVDLVVSDGLGEKMVDIPNIKGLRLSEAQQKLQKAGLRIGEIRFQPSKEFDPNVIINYEPQKDQITVGETLKLIVSERFEVKEEDESGAVIDTSNISSPEDNNN
ncbi:PASTA domain-containing protein [Fodinibius sp.]|uniref:PASTA domain-containing protein n=1 Tax=Fodinibius sp. TaxID=1872440 RepID=UPI002ACEEF8A|nr:PASTA domain-containing protein [Fodinibius sp.]MDZ7660691.1 PASTA domain-containing protein [Fodinibius sp.]